MQEQRPHRTRQISPSPGARRPRLAGDSRAARLHAQMQSRRDWRLQPDERPTAIWQISRADDGAEPNEAILPSLMGGAGRRPACAAVLKPERIGTARASSGSPASAEAAFSGQIGSGQYRSRLPNHQRGSSASTGEEPSGWRRVARRSPRVPWRHVAWHGPAPAEVPPGKRRRCRRTRSARSGVWSARRAHGPVEACPPSTHTRGEFPRHEAHTSSTRMHRHVAGREATLLSGAVRVCRARRVRGGSRRTQDRSDVSGRAFRSAPRLTPRTRSARISSPSQPNAHRDDSGRRIPTRVAQGCSRF